MNDLNTIARKLFFEICLRGIVIHEIMRTIKTLV